MRQSGSRFCFGVRVIGLVFQAACVVTIYSSILGLCCHLVLLGLVTPVLVGCTVLVLGLFLKRQTSWGALLVGLVVSWALPSKPFLSALEAESLFSSLFVFLSLEPVWWGVMAWTLPCMSFPSTLETKAHGSKSLVVAALLGLDLDDVS